MFTFKIILLNKREPIFWETLERDKYLKKLDSKKKLYPNDKIYDFDSFRRDLEYQLGMVMIPFYTEPNTLVWISEFLSEGV